MKDRFDALRRWLGSRAGRVTLVVAGIVAAQFILYGPSLLGSKILLPLDILAGRGVYVPQTPDTARIVPHDPIRSDLIYNSEPSRRFVVEEYRAGRVPLWLPYQFAGAPSIRPPPFTLVRILDYAIASPRVLAWTQVIEALLAGLGAYLFCRRVLRVGPWPATVAAWCYPLTGFFVFWQGYETPGAVLWLPVDPGGRRRRRASGISLGRGGAGRGHVPGAAERPNGYRRPGPAGLGNLCRLVPLRPVRLAVVRPPCADGRGDDRGRLGAGIPVGDAVCPAAFRVYANRLAHGAACRGRGRAAAGRLAAVPQTVLPDMYGSTQQGSFPLLVEGQGNQLESSAAAYAGLLATLLVAPLAWCSRGTDRINIFWIVLGLSRWPGCSTSRAGVAAALPGLNMMSHNRFVFAARSPYRHDGRRTGRALARPLPRRWWFWLPIALVAVLGGLVPLSDACSPEPLATTCGHARRQRPSRPSGSRSGRRARGQGHFCRNLRRGRRAVRPGAGRLAAALVLQVNAAVVPAGAGRLAGGRPALVRLRSQCAVRSGAVLSADSRLGEIGEGDPRPDHRLQLPARPNWPSRATCATSAATTAWIRRG